MVKITVFRDMTPCSLVDGYKVIGGNFVFLRDTVDVV